VEIAKSVLPLITSAIGIIGTFASIFGLSNNPWKYVLMITCIILVLSGIVIFLYTHVHLTIWLRNAVITKKLGIKRIFPSGHDNKKLGQIISKSRIIRIQCTSGILLVRTLKSSIIEALTSNSAVIRILLAQPNSTFTGILEKCESRHQPGLVSNEINQSISLLHEYCRIPR
jgi:hypothetical protein